MRSERLQIGPKASEVKRQPDTSFRNLTPDRPNFALEIGRLASEAQGGSEGALSELFESLIPFLRSRAQQEFPPGPGWQDADDTVIEAATRIYKALPTYDFGEVSFLAWSTHLLRCVVIGSNWVGPKRPISLTDICLDPTDENIVEDVRQMDFTKMVHQSMLESIEDSETAIEKREMFESIEKAMKQLTPKSRRIVLLHFHKGMSARQIAHATNETVASVRYKLYKSLYQLRRRVTQEFE